MEAFSAEVQDQGLLMNVEYRQMGQVSFTRLRIYQCFSFFVIHTYISSYTIFDRFAYHYQHHHTSFLASGVYFGIGPLYSQIRRLWSILSNGVSFVKCTDFMNMQNI